MFIIPQEDANLEELLLLTVLEELLLLTVLGELLFLTVLEELLLLTVLNHRFLPIILIQIITVHFQVQKHCITSR